MDNGHYTFDMTQAEFGTEISGEIYQYDTADGEQGTQTIVGYRDGNTLYVRGTRLFDASPNWELDIFTLELSPGGDTLRGTFRCEPCSTSKGINGHRTG